MITSKESGENLRSVIVRLIELIKNDLNELNQLLQYTDPFTLKQKQDDVQMKRQRCSTLLKVLQNALATEIEIDGKPNHVLTTEQSKTADKIMNQLRNYRFIESSELAQYLKKTIRASKDIVSTNDVDSESCCEQRLPKSIKKLKNVYDSRRKVIPKKPS